MNINFVPVTDHDTPIYTLIMLLCFMSGNNTEKCCILSFNKNNTDKHMWYSYIFMYMFLWLQYRYTLEGYN